MLRRGALFIGALLTVFHVLPESLYAQPPAEAEQSATPGHRPITFAIEAGSDLPEQVLLELKPQDKLLARFELLEGNAKFGSTHLSLDQLRENGRVVEIPVRGGIVTMPPLQAGTVDDVSLVHVTVNGTILLDDLRVVTLSPGDMETLRAEIEGFSEAVLAMADTYAIIDEEKLIPYLDQSTGETQGFEGAPCGSYPCTRAPVGPGEVKWLTSNPAAEGYSVKPETGSTLVWATPPIQYIDGIYKTNWGCSLALKVPDSCTAEVSGGEIIECCCNATLYLLGYKCKAINPYLFSDWPDCPLPL